MAEKQPTSGQQLTERQTELKERFKREVGIWNQKYEDWLVHDTDYFEIFTNFAAQPWKSDVIDPKTKALVTVALTANVSYLNRESLRLRIRRAFKLGASFEEIREVLHCVSGLGIQTLIDISPMLKDQYGVPGDLSEEEVTKRDEVRELFKENRGYWSDFWETVLQMDPDYLETYTHLSSYPWNEGVLDPKQREFIYITIDATTTHLYTKGLEQHMVNAIEYGATREELFELAELISTIGYESMPAGMNELIEEARAHGELPVEDD